MIGFWYLGMLVALRFCYVRLHAILFSWQTFNLKLGSRVTISDIPVCNFRSFFCGKLLCSLYSLILCSVLLYAISFLLLLILVSHYDSLKLEF